MFWSQKKSNKTLPGKKYTECTYKHKNYLYIFIYIRSIPREWAGQLCTNKAPLVTKSNKETEWKKPGRWERHEVYKIKKKPNQMESMANAATACCGCSSQGRLRTLDSETKNLYQVSTQAGSDLWSVWVSVIWHPVSKLACDGEGTLRFQGYFPLFL